MTVGMLDVCRYLEYVRIPHTEPMEHEFRWGQRADMEVSKAKILEFMGQVSGLLVTTVLLCGAFFSDVD